MLDYAGTLDTSTSSSSDWGSDAGIALGIAPIVAWLVVGTIFAVWASAVAKARHRREASFVVLGYFIGPFAVAAALLAAPGNRPAPAGTRALICARCGTHQNIGNGVFSFDCWKCSTKQTAPSLVGKIS